MRTTSKSRIVIATAGTWGDLLPFVELGRALFSRGHEITIACGTGLHEWVERAGLKAAPFDGDFGKERAQAQARSWDQWDEPGPASINQELSSFFEQVARNSHELAALARSADLILVPTNCIEGRIVHEMTGVAWLSVTFMPQPVFRPASDEADLREKLLVEHVEKLERRLGLRPRRQFTSYRDYKRSNPSLLACSEAFVQVEDPMIWQTGFWFYEDPDWANWKPEERLLAFMQNGSPPLVLSFSSLPLVDPKQVLDVHVRAATLLKRRLVVQQGWSGFSPEMVSSDIERDQIYMAEFIPHDWFFARAAGLITHGGVGTVGRALRNACPLLVEPYGNDQFYNALLVKKLGYGTAAHPKRLNAEGLAQLMQDKLLDPRSRDRVASAAAVIKSEDGVRRACEFIEGYA